jgi:hypothetical protein
MIICNLSLMNYLKQMSVTHDVNVQFSSNQFFKQNAKRFFTYFFCLIRKSNKKNQEANMLPRASQPHPRVCLVPRARNH